MDFNFRFFIVFQWVIHTHKNAKFILPQNFVSVPKEQKGPIDKTLPKANLIEQTPK
jgi:hypothetical protein